MKLYYAGSIHRLQGSGMAFKSFEREIDLDIPTSLTTEVPDTRLNINVIEAGQVFFDVVFFDKTTSYVIHFGEKVIHRQEGNAFGFDLNFELRE